MPYIVVPPMYWWEWIFPSLAELRFALTLMSGLEAECVYVDKNGHGYRMNVSLATEEIHG
jgi:hypothetical protein